MSISKSDFNANRVNDGGAIHTTGEVSLLESEFRDNEALNDSGAVVAAGADLTVEDCEFTGNAAGRNGGSLYAYDSEASILKSFFKVNKADFGGAISNVKKVMDISDSEFIENLASESGAAIYLDKFDFEGGDLDFSGNRLDDVFN